MASSIRFRRHLALAARALACLVGIPALAAACLSVPARAETASPCAGLLKMELAAGKIDSTTVLAGSLPKEDMPTRRGPNGPYLDPAFKDLPRFCRAFATLSPVPGSKIGIELWLPEQWNGKLLAIGNHGFGGEFERADMAVGLHRGYAVVSNDTGHRAAYSIAGGFSVGSAKFASEGGEVAIDDYSWRSVHATALAAKAIVARYYGVAPRHAYFDGCSKGGGQAMREAQQFPDDFDGVIAGSAAMYATRLFASDLWAYKLGDLGGGLRMTSPKLALAQQAATAECDKLDGLADGVVADVAGCVWHPARLRCRPGQDPSSCLTAAEVAAITKAEQPLRDPSTGEALYPGFAPTGESRWISPLGGMGAVNPVTDNYFRYMVANDPNWSADAADPVKLLRQSEDPASPLSRSNAISPDLSGFERRGGKLIQYHGWSDEAMVPGFTARYYIEVVDLQPGSDKIGRTRSFYRLFMVPGMGHCIGGTAPVNFGGLAQQPSSPIDADHDVLEALDHWVDHGVAPERIIATSYAEQGKTARQMPLCPFPAVAMYTGGDVGTARSFECRFPSKRSSSTASARPR